MRLVYSGAGGIFHYYYVHGKPVDPNLWRISGRSPMILYDLRPDRGLAQ